jgi:phosphopantetheinyl transferase (holo-ACP synthase)
MVNYSGEAQKQVLKNRIERTLISLSDEHDFAVAFVTLLQSNH